MQKAKKVQPPPYEPIQPVVKPPPMNAYADPVVKEIVKPTWRGPRFTAMSGDVTEQLTEVMEAALSEGEHS